MRQFRAPGLLALVGVLLLLVAVWLAVDNPTIDSTSKGDAYSCSAPYDTVLNGADNFPGGETPVDADNIANRCVEVGENRFWLAIAAGALGSCVLSTALFLGMRSRGRRADLLPATR